jgi:transcriptional regulator with XRE-family HTH domain
MDTLSQRLKHVLSIVQIKQYLFAESIGISRSYLTKLLNGERTNISKSAALIIEEKYGFDRHWIGTGEGNMMIQRDESARKLEVISRIRDLSPIELDALIALLDSLDTYRDGRTGNLFD